MGETVTFEKVRCLKETDAALLVEIDGTEVWIPKSQVDDESEVFDEDDNAEGRLVVTEWFCRERGLI